MIKNRQVLKNRIIVEVSYGNSFTIMYRDLVGADNAAKAEDLKNKIQEKLDFVVNIEDLPDDDVIKVNKEGTREDMCLSECQIKEDNNIRTRSVECTEVQVDEEQGLFYPSFRNHKYV